MRRGGSDACSACVCLPRRGVVVVGGEGGREDGLCSLG